MSNFQAALAPNIPEDDGKPIVRPRAITISSVLAVIAAALLLYAGVGGVVTLGSAVAGYRTTWSQAAAECTTQYGGFGTVVPASAAAPTATSISGPISASALPSVCRSIDSPTLTAAAESSFRTQATVIGALLVIMGIAVGIAGWSIRKGVKWCRRVLVGVALVSLLAALLAGISNAVTLVATLLLVVGLLMAYLGRGGVFFAQLAQRRAKH